MFKPVFLSGLFSFSILSLLSVPIAAFGQAQGLTSQAQTQSTASENIPALELQQFVQIRKRWQSVDQDSQRKMVGEI